MASSTMTRLVAVHFWPVEKNAALRVFSTAVAKSASAERWWDFCRPFPVGFAGLRREAFSCSQSPISQEPVNETALSRPGIDQGFSQFAAGAGDEIDDALGDAGLVQRLHHAPRAERRGGGGLEDNGVAADERGRELPGGDGAGEVPGRDQAHDAEGLRMANMCTRSRSEGTRTPACASLLRRNSGGC